MLAATEQLTKGRERKRRQGILKSELEYQEFKTGSVVRLLLQRGAPAAGQVPDFRSDYYYGAALPAGSGPYTTRVAAGPFTLCAAGPSTTSPAASGRFGGGSDYYSAGGRRQVRRRVRLLPHSRRSGSAAGPSTAALKTARLAHLVAGPVPGGGFREDNNYI